MLPTVAVAAALALAPLGADAFPKRGKLSDRFGFPDRDAPDNNGFTRTKPKTVVSSARCESVAITKNFSASKDAHAYAIAEAWKVACSDDVKHDDWYWAHIYKHVFDAWVDRDYGYVFAKAIAATAAQCDTYGNAYGCASSYAYSAAWARAVAHSHAAAWATAVNDCKCNDKRQITAADSDVYAVKSQYFERQVEAVAESSACGYRGHDQKDYDAQTCVQNVYFTAVARAVAIAAIDGECVHQNLYDGSSKEYGEFLAKAKANAVAKITSEQVYGCVGYISSYNPYH